MRRDETNRWTRREFTAASALAMLSGVAVTISGCGDNGGSTSPTSTSAPTPTLGEGDVAGVVGGNHGHTAVIRSAMLSAGNAVDLDISGNAGHPHSVSLSADEVGQIAGGERVRKTSSTNLDHSHTVTFN